MVVLGLVVGEQEKPKLQARRAAKSRAAQIPTAISRFLFI
jgi:hypothetical protein